MHFQQVFGLPLNESVVFLEVGRADVVFRDERNDFDSPSLSFVPLALVLEDAFWRVEA